MSNRLLSSLLLPLLLLVLAACGGDVAEGTPQIRYGEDACDQCHMIIGEPRFATAYIAEDGTAHRFDDIGEMFLYMTEGGEAVREAWVHDYGDESWLATEEATFVHNPRLVTPMGWGLAAFAAREQAEAYQAEHGGVLLSLAELQSRIEAGELQPGAMTGMHNHAPTEHEHNEVVNTRSSHSHEEK